MADLRGEEITIVRFLFCVCVSSQSSDFLFKESGGRVTLSLVCRSLGEGGWWRGQGEDELFKSSSSPSKAVACHLRNGIAVPACKTLTLLA
jgi:hypothetical protein